MSVFTLRLEREEDRPDIYRLRHEVFAREMQQYPVVAAGALFDEIDQYNHYLVVEREDRVIGFVSVTPPGHRYSFEKRFPRPDLPFSVDEGLFETRLIAIDREQRLPGLAHALFYGVYRWVTVRGGSRLVTTAHDRILDLYRSIGLEKHDLQTTVGQVQYHLMSAPMTELRKRIRPMVPVLRRTLDTMGLEWQLTEPFEDE